MTNVEMLNRFLNEESKRTGLEKLAILMDLALEAGNETFNPFRATEEELDDICKVVEERTGRYGETQYEEFRTISASRMRSLCIEWNWYTCGTNEEYEHLLLDLCEAKQNLTTEDIIEIAKDIMEHSDPNEMEEQTIASIAFEVARIAVSRFHIRWRV